MVRCLNQETFDDMCLAAFSSNALKMDLRKLLVLQQMKEITFTELIINSSYGPSSI